MVIMDFFIIPSKISTPTKQIVNAKIHITYADRQQCRAKIVALEIAITPEEYFKMNPVERNKVCTPCVSTIYRFRSVLQ